MRQLVTPAWIPAQNRRRITMIHILIDAAVLMCLLQVMSGEEIGYTTAALISVVVAVGTLLASTGLVAMIGVAGVVVAAAAGALFLGILVSALWGLEIKRSFLIGALFMVAHIAVGLTISAIMRA
jgi:hypothetical protein